MVVVVADLLRPSQEQLEELLVITSAQRRTSAMTDTETTTTTETTTVTANDVADLGSVLGSADPRDEFKTNAIPHDEEATGLPEMVPAPDDEDDGDDSDEDDSENDSTDGGESGPDETGGEGGNA